MRNSIGYIATKMINPINPSGHPPGTGCKGKAPGNVGPHTSFWHFMGVFFPGFSCFLRGWVAVLPSASTTFALL